MAGPRNLDFLLEGYITKKSGSMLKTLVPKFGPDLSTRLKHIAEKQVPTELKPIVVYGLHLYGTIFIPWEAFSQGLGSQAAVIILVSVADKVKSGNFWPSTWFVTF